MRHTLLLAVLFMLSSAPARAQDSTTRAPVPVADTAKLRVDSVARVARRIRDQAHCYGREALKQGSLAAFSGALFGAALGAVPAGLLGLFKFHQAARTVFWVPTVSVGLTFGFYGTVLGPLACQ
ncbi:MAG TPA: hypothetical protein VII52_04240 [Gemmatimonadaceae bacterium]